MGVSGLTGILSRYAPNSIRIISSSSLTRQTIAVDASCHLNKFIYGDDPHYQRHIHGFYQLARFFDMNNIKPIFVFDGPSRLKAKQSEHEKREQTREKTRYSLLFQKEQLLRMENWMEVSNQCHQANYSPTKESIITILTELGEKVDQIESRLPSVDNEKIDSIDKQQIIENKLTSTAQKLRSALEAVKDTNHYTKTVRDLAKREKSLILEMLLNSSSSTQFSLDMLKRDNQAMLASLDPIVLHRG
ncbi:PIN domain-like protein [Cokeromyces recurvatus]|uniref:PIN domain-like protein n=1 Tax=Cokeromyces recurvatus TaxID=90255 RepID=UPI00221FBEBE|nr:PIN domain-like protein [Cokeromyces recurvatus]KAI7901500.1 PIN domain-like protein [Cokeromyces recurvatus]